MVKKSWMGWVCSREEVWEMLVSICLKLKKYPLGVIPKDVHPYGWMVLG